MPSLSTATPTAALVVSALPTELQLEPRTPASTPMACSTRTLANPARWSTRSSRCRTRWATKLAIMDTNYGNFIVSRQHQVIIYEPRDQGGQDYYCWDYTTQAACANFTPSDDNLYPRRGVHDSSRTLGTTTVSGRTPMTARLASGTSIHTGAFATSGGECVLSAVTTTVTLTYDPQGGTGAPADQTGPPESDVTVSTTEPTRDGYAFQGWNTQADGNGTSYSGGDTYTLPNSGTDTLYVQWQINTVTLTYDPQGGTGEPADQTGDAASDVTVSTTEPTRDGYTFQGWNTQADGNGIPYSGGDTYTLPTSGTDTL